MDDRLRQIQKLLDSAEANLKTARNSLNELLKDGTQETKQANHSQSAKDLSILNDGKVIEGIFDGEEMVAPDGKKYPVPANYASKSKLVEGDTLKLTITEDGSFVFKQIGPVERKRVIGTLAYENGEYSVLADGKKYKLLFASVSYYKGKAGDRAAVIIPADLEAAWAAMESIIHDHQEQEPTNAAKETEKPIAPSQVTQEKETETPPASQAEVPQEEKPKTNLSQENAEILENLRKSLSHHEAAPEVVSEPTQEPQKEQTPEAPAEQSPVAENAPIEPTPAPQTPATPVEPKTLEEAYNDKGEPQIIKHETYTPSDDDSLVENETEKNSIGEEIKKKEPGAGIEELEI